MVFMHNRMAVLPTCFSQGIFKIGRRIESRELWIPSNKGVRFRSERAAHDRSLSKKVRIIYVQGIHFAAIEFTHEPISALV